MQKYTHRPSTRSSLQKIIQTVIEQRGVAADLNHIDVSKITNFSELFRDTLFVGDVSKWNVAAAKNMTGMFRGCPFNGDISNWNTGNVTSMFCMFAWSSFNGDISRWNVSSVRDMSSMFHDSDFNGDVSSWHVQPGTRKSAMFLDTPFKGCLKSWSLASAELENMFGFGGEPLCSQFPLYLSHRAMEDEKIALQKLALHLPSSPHKTAAQL